jgi:hypothetical protein
MQVGDAILAAGLLASGLRSNFKAQAHNLTACILDKFKDKSTIVVRNVLTAATNFITHCYALTDITDELVAALNHKVPKVRATRMIISISKRQEPFQSCSPSLREPLRAWGILFNLCYPAQLGRKPMGSQP